MNRDITINEVTSTGRIIAGKGEVDGAGAVVCSADLGADVYDLIERQIAAGCVHGTADRFEWEISIEGLPEVEIVKPSGTSSPRFSGRFFQTELAEAVAAGINDDGLELGEATVGGSATAGVWRDLLILPRPASHPLPCCWTAERSARTGDIFRTGATSNAENTGNGNGRRAGMESGRPVGWSAE